MNFPPDWDIFPTNTFELAVPRDPQDVGVELMAQVQANLRILDHSRIAVGGNVLLEAEFLLSSVMAEPEMPAWKFVYHSWPRDVHIRRNMASSEWMDFTDIIRSNDARVVDLEADAAGQALDSRVYLDWQSALADKKTNSFSVRWAVCAGEDGKVQLQLQALPAPASSFSGKPAFRG